jgi:hypothetical protein
MKTRVDIRLWTSRVLIALVVAWNLQAALAFLLTPEAFSPGFELNGVPGAATMRGIAILFLMWNIPYLVALWQPRRHRISLWEALAMQAVGVIGESMILFLLPSGHDILHASILRFIYFDGAGLVALVIATAIAGK